VNQVSDVLAPKKRRFDSRAPGGESDQTSDAWCGSSSDCGCE
jgi:hypothetical protein